MKKLAYFLTFTVVIFLFSVEAPAGTIVTDGLVSYWTFDRHDINGKIAEDVWGENDAVIMGSPKIAVGYLRQALKLGGLGDYVILENLGNFSQQLGPYSFEVWLKTSYKGYWTAIYKVIECDRGDSDRGCGILINATRGPIEQGDPIITTKDFILCEQSVKHGENACGGGSSAFRHLISDGKWHHIVYVRGSMFADTPGPRLGETALYIDGEQVRGWKGGGLNRNDIMPFTLPIYLGAVNHNGKARGFFRGVMDEVRVYNRALSDKEILQNFRSKIGLAVQPTQKLSTVWAALKAR